MFSILVPTWNNLAYLRLCVDALRRHSRRAHQIVVHVNDGSDGTRDWVRAEGLDASASDRNIGICLAVNEAAQLARGDYLVYLNDDMVCLPGWDTALERRIAAMPDDRFLLSGTMIEPRASGNACAIVADFGDRAETFRGQALIEAAPALARADWCGSTWPPTVVHRRWWFAVGGYSIEFSPGMSSDNDFAMKLWQAGCRRYFGAGDALVYHFQCKSTGRIDRNDGRRQFLQKWGVTQTTFDRHYLRRGQPWTGTDLAEPTASAGFGWDRWRSRLKRRLA